MWIQVIGIEGHNPSGHCLIASKVVDSMPSVDDGLPPSKRQATDHEHQPSSEPSISRMLSVVSILYLDTMDSTV